MGRIKDKSNIGVIAMSIYVPRLFIDMREYETTNNISKNKITKGLGQKNMSFVTKNEDSTSMALNALKQLLSNPLAIKAKIKKLEFATETIHDKSKSPKTILINLLKPYTNVEGVTNLNACYGGTAALFNCFDFISTHPGLQAVVVMSDIAVYDNVTSEPTGGVGAVALLIGEGAGVVMSKQRYSYFKDVYDFYKPKLDTQYPIVNGKYSIRMYNEAMWNCWTQFHSNNNVSIVDDFDFYCFHCPFSKMSIKSFLYLIYRSLKEQHIPTKNN